MNKIQILDCTLRDGGYINEWDFGKNVIKKILKYLYFAQVDIVECGFYSDVEYDDDKSLYSHPDQIQAFLPVTKQKYVAMIALGEKEIHYSKVPPSCDTPLWGIRITFHKHEIEKAFEFARDLMDKGYQVFMQPVGTCTYSDRELLELVDKINTLEPYAFYIVDTLGTINGTELMRLFGMLDNNLAKGITIGFHSHNNMQLAFTNAQELIRTFTHRNIIIDASVLGMGRGAGNLCTELIAQYMNDVLGTTYDVMALLEIVDRYLVGIKEKYPWGYAIPYYISAMNNCHPNYATFFMNKQTLRAKDIEKIITELPDEKRTLFDKAYAAELYNKYQTNYTDDKATVKELREVLREKNVLILAPGNSIVKEREAIKEYIAKNNSYVISVNFESKIYLEDMLFVSNSKRFEDIDVNNLKESNRLLTVTSNIPVDSADGIYKVNYSSYLNSDSMVCDNAGLMCLQLLRDCRVRKIAMAGFDGFDLEVQDNYFSKDLYNHVERQTLREKTERIKQQIKRLKAEMDITFVTESKYED